MKKKYEVNFMQYSEGFLEVEAEDEDEARDLAYEILYDCVDHYVYQSDLEVQEVVAVDES